MAESTRYHRMTLTFLSAWNLGTATTQDWALKFSLSGASALADADVETTALDLAAPPLSIVAPGTSLTRVSYYHAGSTVAAKTLTYPVGTHPGTAAAWTGGPVLQQLEVCVLARCPVQKSSRGKQVFLRKWIHNVRAISSNGNQRGDFLNPVSVVFAKWNTGSGPQLLVPVSPTTGVQGGPWDVESHLFTHQLRRGAKHKLVIAGNSIDIPPVPLAPAA